jgi:hypothetical protein
MFPLRVLTSSNDTDAAFQYRSAYLYDIYFDDATNKIFVAYLDNWVIQSGSYKRPDTVKVAILTFNSSTLKYEDTEIVTETVVVNPVPAPTGPYGLASPRIFKTSTGDITVSFSAFIPAAFGQGQQTTRRFYVYKRTGNNSWSQVRGGAQINMQNRGSVLSYR